MIKLIPFELLKIWHKRSFQVLIGTLLIINIFLLWYLNTPTEDMPSLSAYKAVSRDISSMSEEKKLEYITDLKEQIDNINFVYDVCICQSLGNEMGEVLAKQMLDSNPGVFEEYYDDYINGSYLTYTDSLFKEKILIDEVYKEIKKVGSFDEYIDSIKQNKDNLGSISIFKTVSEDSFSSRNIEKSAADHEGLSSENISFYPSKGISIAMESSITDIFLILSIFLFVGSLISEEKEKGLFYITRATKNGIANCIGSKLIALLIHCVTISVLLYGSNLLFAGLTTGLCDFTASIQSIASYMESDLSISIMGYVIFCILTKSMILFGLGIALTILSICTSKSFFPQLIGVGWLVLNWFAYTGIPSYSSANPIKFLSFFGLMKTENLYGGYLNLNVFEHAVPRLPLALFLVGTICVIGIMISFICFRRGSSLEIRKTHISSHIPFHPHGSLLRHEGYKILFTNKAIIILLVFAILIGFGDFGKTYSPSISEQYYQDIMLKLEGELTPDKEELVSTEQARYDEAFEQIELIDAMVARGEIDANTGDYMKMKWYGEVTLYLAFQRVLLQYDSIKESGGVFVYDTGYRYIFGAMDDSFLTDLLILSLCMVFAFSNVFSMEYQKKSWYLLSATFKGKQQIIRKKIIICTLCTMVMTILPWIFRSICISDTYPMHNLLNSIKNIPIYFEFGVDIPIVVFIVFACLSQIAAIMIIVLVILFFSWWRRNNLQALFLTLLILVVPIVLAIMGIDFAKWFSIYPLYSWMAYIKNLGF